MTDESSAAIPQMVKRAAVIMDGLPERTTDPFTAVLMILSFVAATDALTGWREEWDERTTIGRVVFAIFAPLRLFMGVIAGSVFLVLALWQLLFIAIFAVPEYLHMRYREVAFKEP